MPTAQKPGHAHEPCDDHNVVDAGGVLDDVLASVRAKKAAGTTPVVVFDLDHTLFDNGPRTLEILREFARDGGDDVLLGHLSRPVKGIVPYLMSDLLPQIGENRPGVMEAAAAYWRDRFFTDDWQRLDVPMPGAAEFAVSCFEAGATVVYLSGRDAPNMLVGCIESLRRFGFPVGLAHTLVVLKPHFDLNDFTFKEEVTGFLATLGEVVASFDNEPANCNLFARKFPSACTVFLDTAFAPGAPSLDPGIPLICDFARDA